METSSTEASTQRGARGSRGSRISATRGNQPERPSSPRNKSPTSKSSKEEQSRPIRGGQNSSRGTRGSRPRGRGRIMRRGIRQRPQNFRRRFRRIPFQMRNRRGRRGGFRPRPRNRNFGYSRRFFGNRSIFIKGFPQKITESYINEMLRKEGRVLRVTLLKDSRGESRGMAFAEFQYPRDALKVVQNYRGKKFEGNDIFVAFKRDNNRFRNNNYPRYFNRNRNARPNYRPRFNPNGFQRPMRPPRGAIRGRGRGRGRGY